MINVNADLNFHSKGEEVVPDRLSPGEEQEREVDEADEAGSQEEQKPKPEEEENLLDNVLSCQDTNEIPDLCQYQKC